jgi:hypothetical protein
MGSAMAARERRPLIPDTPIDPTALTEELRELVRRLQVDRVMRSWTSATQFVTGQPHDARLFLLRLDITANKLHITSYHLQQQKQASDDYLTVEKEIDEKNINEQVVLVSAESVESLPKAYPNYYVDTNAFLATVKQAIS